MKKQASTSRVARGELELIRSIRSRAAGQKAGGGLRLGIGDDCALLRLRAGEDAAVTTDLSLETVHFRRDWHPAEAAGHRCLARGLSDLAAMGARPVAAFLSLAAPAELIRPRSRQPGWVDRFLDGLLALAGRYHVPLGGGDTAQAPRVVGLPPGQTGLVAADIVLVGAVERSRALLRGGARPGDALYVTGALGGAAAELLALERSPERFRRLRQAAEGHPHLYPEPRLAAGRRLAEGRLATAAIDLSDGLSTDLAHLCAESGVRAEIDAAALPVHTMARLAEAAGLAPSALRLALHGGEDYELLFTAPPKARIPIRIAGVPVTRIGRVLPPQGGPQVTLLGADGQGSQLEAGGWEHFES